MAALFLQTRKWAHETLVDRRVGRFAAVRLRRAQSHHARPCDASGGTRHAFRAGHADSRNATLSLRRQDRIYGALRRRFSDRRRRATWLGNAAAGRRRRHPAADGVQQSTRARGVRPGQFRARSDPSICAGATGCALLAGLNTSCPYTVACPPPRLLSRHRSGRPKRSRRPQPPGALRTPGLHPPAPFHCQSRKHAENAADLQVQRDPPCRGRGAGRFTGRVRRRVGHAVCPAGEVIGDAPRWMARTSQDSLPDAT